MTRGVALSTAIVVLLATAILAIVLTGAQVAGEFGGPDWSQLSPRPSP